MVKIVKNLYDILNESDDFKYVDPSTYNFGRQQANYDNIRAILDPLGLKLTKMEAGIRGGLQTFELWTPRYDDRSRQPLFRWYKYEGGSPGSGQNHVFFGGGKYKLTEFLSSPDIQNVLKRVVEKSSQGRTHEEFAFEQYFKVTGTYEIENGVVNVTGNCSAKPSLKKIAKIPVKFGAVTGAFKVRSKGLISLDGGPTEAQLYDCSYNELSNLIGLPKSIDILDVTANPLKSLDGLERVHRLLSISYNEELPILTVYSNMIKGVTVSWHGSFYSGGFSDVNRDISSFIWLSRDLSLKKKLWQIQQMLVDSGHVANARW
jgi:hypothetical protein